MSQLLPDFAPIEVLAAQVSDSWFNGVIIESLTHGMYTALLAVVLWRILSSSTSHRGQTKVLAGISVFMYIMATMHLSVRWFYARRAFITKGETEETRFYALIDSLIAGGPLWVPTISSVVASINILIADCVIVTSLARHTLGAVVIFGFRFGGAGLSGKGTGGSSSFLPYARYVEQELTPLTNPQGKPVTPWGSNSINWGIAYYSMTLSTTVICTALIVFRLTRASRTGKSLRFGPDPYHKVMEIMVESAALYVVALAVYIPFIATNSPYSNYPQVVLASVTVS
ncbi:uncharacterized protein EV420DRAFT_1762739 [Desarmillaria tabescens]|uniref:Uncharacterized protein n=1 Tax=Armillaria tabescens TaxID=1929756 RepID=A0AA39TIW1_ARMTA|nr:uncharacterized protein EV420DRAFT_1762739 [Desarmillaria tabescens]KAK0460467.1 hypothetical protein EV420DRAFT_1762739 [Desarmillaria tabescens]